MSHGPCGRAGAAVRAPMFCAAVVNMAPLATSTTATISGGGGLCVIASNSLAHSSGVRPRVPDGSSDQLFQRRQMYVAQALDVYAPFAARVLPEFLKELLPTAQLRPQIESQGGLAWRKRNDHPFGLLAARAGPPVAAETDDAAAPHFRFAFRGLLHDANERAAVLAYLLTR